MAAYNVSVYMDGYSFDVEMEIPYEQDDPTIGDYIMDCIQIDWDLVDEEDE